MNLLLCRDPLARMSHRAWCVLFAWLTAGSFPPATAEAADFWAPRPAFAPCFERDGADVTALAIAPDGAFYVAGDFSLYTTRARLGLVRFHADGSLDESFIPTGLPVGLISALAVEPDGRLVVAGLFDFAGSEPAHFIVRLTADGAVDPTFQAGTNLNGTVDRMIRLADGRLVLAGTFSRWGDAEVPRVIRLHGDGTLDTGFESALPEDAVVFALAEQTDGRLLVGGMPLSGIGGRLWRLNTDGTLDGSLLTGAGFNGVVRSVVALADGRILAGGAFSLYAGFDRTGVARLLSTGALDTTFDPGNAVPGGARVLLPASGGRVLVDGRVLLTADGGVDPAYDGGAGFGGAVQAAVWLPDGSLLAGGAFTAYRGVERRGVARVGADGTLVAGFAPKLRRPGMVTRVFPLADGSWLVGGLFEYVNGVARDRVAWIAADGSLDDRVAAPEVDRLNSALPDGTLYAHVGNAVWRYLPDGSRDMTFELPAALNTAYDQPLVPVDGGRLLLPYAAGATTSAIRGRVSRRLGDGSEDGTYTTALFSQGGGIGEVRALVLTQAGGGYAGGRFDSVANGSAATRGNIVRLLPDGGVDGAFNPGTGFDDAVEALAVQGDGSVIVGGWFTEFSAGVTPTPLGRIARLGADGLPDPAFAGGAGFDRTVYALALDSSGRIWAGGDFHHHGATRRRGLARVLGDGALDTAALIPEAVTWERESIPTGPRQLRVVSDTVVAVAGTWLRAGAARFGGFALFERASAPVVTVQPAGGDFEAGRRAVLVADAVGAGPVTYQWQRDGVAIAGATGATYVLESAQAFHAGAYTVVVGDGEGATTSAAATIDVTAAPSPAARVLNLSTRTRVDAGDGVLVAGFVIQGTGTRRVLMRGVGPGLEAFGVEGVLADPHLWLVRPEHPLTVVHADNDNWGEADNAGDIAAAAAEVGAFPLDDDSADAALLLDLEAGSYTAIIDGADGAEGVAIAELYDAEDGPGTARLVNLSTRGRAGAGHAVMIPGFVVSNDGPKTLLVRGVGPGLAAHGIDEPLADPVLTVFAADGRVLFSNDDWGSVSTAEQTRTVAELVGAFALEEGSKDAALVVTLQPGAYTIHISGVDGAEGVALAEVYLVP